METSRRAVGEDTPRVARLAADLGYTITSDSVGAAIDWLQSDEGAIFVADASEHLTGWIHVYRSHVIQTEPFAEVGGLVVDPLNRGDGVGQRLLEAAERWASANDLTLVRVRSNIVLSNAHRYYERRGYDVEKTSYTFSKSLNNV